MADVIRSEARMYISHILCYIQTSYGCFKEPGLRFLPHAVNVHNSDVTVMKIMGKIYTDMWKKDRSTAEKPNINNPCMV